MKKKILALLLVLTLVLTACGKTNTNSNQNKNTEENKDTKENEEEKKSQTENKNKQESKVENKDNVKESKKLKIVTSFYPGFDFVSKIGKDKVEVINLTKSGSAHGFEPGIKEMEDILSSNLLVINGAGFEGWIEKIESANKGLYILDLSENLKLIESDGHDHDHKDDHDDRHDHDHKDDHDDKHDHDHDDDVLHLHDHDHDHDGHSHGKYDPHTWLSIKNAVKMLETVKNKLVELDPENKDFYEANFAENKVKFEELDKKFTQQLAPHKGKEIFVPHAAFGYLAKDYGFEQEGIEGINSDSEPNVSRMKEIIDEMTEHKAKTVFYEYGRSDKIAKTIAEQIGGNFKAISTLEVLSQEDIQKGSEYLSLMEMNLKNIVDSFEGR